RQPKPRGIFTCVFSSPAANVGAPLISHTAWWRGITSTRGTEPPGRRRLGRKPTIQPGTFGRGTLSPSIEIVFCPGWMLTGPYLKCRCWTRGAAEALAGTSRRASRIRPSRGSTASDSSRSRIVYVAVRMRGVWTLVAVLGAFALLAATAVAHPERQAFFPDPKKGAVPYHGGHNKKPLIVCKSNSKRLIKKIFKGKKRRGKRLQRLGQYKRCRFHNIQTAVNHAKSNDRIAILPGLYR